MNLQYYAVKDLAQNAFANLMPVPGHGVAIRSFQSEINRKTPDNIMSQHPEDFELWFIGTFDTENGTMDTREQHRLARGSDLFTKD